MSIPQLGDHASYTCTHSCVCVRGGGVEGDGFRGVFLCYKQCYELEIESLTLERELKLIL